MEEQKFDLEHQFDLYMERMKLDKRKMPEIQLRETKRAFYGACGQMLLLLRDDVSALPDEEGIKALDRMFNQVSSFWLREHNLESAPGKQKIGVAIDQWKVEKYRMAIEKEGFEIERVLPNYRPNFALITVLTDEHGKNRLAVLLKKLERKYSQRNRMN